MDLTMARVPVDGGELEVNVQGSGEAVVFIHGSGPADSFLPLAIEPVLRDHYREIRYRRRGYGRSTPASVLVPVTQHAADCQALLGSLHVANAHVVGHSYGGCIALQLAVNAPELVHTLALFEPALLTGPGAAQFFAEVMAPIFAQYAAGDRAGAGEAFLAAVNGPDWRSEIGHTVPGGVEQAIKDVAMVFESDLPSLSEWRFGADEAARINQPVLYLGGSSSLAFVAEIHELVHAWLPQTEDDVLPGANHSLHMRDPAGAASRLASFLKRHPVAA
jgi:pimeloyl-ACP methyl ester carboxylesterase